MHTSSVVAIAATFTAEPLEPVLRFWLDALGLDASVAFAPYNQVFQQLLDSNSLLARNRGVNVVLVRFEDWIRDERHSPESTGDASIDWFGLPRHRLPNGLEVAHLNRDETEHLYRELFLNQAYLRHGITLRDGAVIVDAGANIGMFSLFAASRCRHPRVLAFEPIPAVANLLRANGAMHGLDLKVFECGLADRNAEVEFTFYRNFSVVSGFQADHHEDATFLRDAITSSLTRGAGTAVDTEVVQELSTHLVAKRLEHERLVRPIRRLSDVLRHEDVTTIDLLKIDVEKSELATLAGIDDEDWKRVQQVVMEVHHRGDALATCSRLLERHGFDVVLEEEQDLKSTGVWNLFAMRPAYRDAMVAEQHDRERVIDRNLNDLTAALTTAVSASASPYVVVCCPPSSFDAARPDAATFFARAATALKSQLAPLRVPVISATDAVDLYECADYYDAKGDELAHMPFNTGGNAVLGTLVARAARAVLERPAKVVAVDCDNTLWGGVCAEDGPLGIRLDAAHLALQQYLVDAHDRGILVCLCSKNSEPDVWEVFARRPEMRLRREHVVSSRINWRPKSESLQALAEELNLSLDAFVFIDDNPLECAEVRAHAPDVVTLQWPTDPTEALRFPRHLWPLDQLRTTGEDARRTEMYKQEVARKQLRQTATRLEDFLESLQVRTTIAPMSADQLPRTAQLTERTNQFNFTTVRRSEAQLRALAAEGFRLEVVAVHDRFGDYGLVGVVISRPEPSRGALAVETFLLSCRVLGKGVEQAVIRHLGVTADADGLHTIELPYRSTPRNAPALAFAGALGGTKREISATEFVFIVSTPAAKALHLAPSHVLDVVATDDEARPRPSGSQQSPRPSSQVYQRIVTELTTAARIQEAMSEGQLDGGRERVDSTPTTQLEAKLASIWTEQLRVGQIGINDNFFDLGGDSIIAIQVMSRAAQAGIKLGMRDLFQHPTIGELAQAIASRHDAHVTDDDDDGIDEAIELTPIQRWFFEKRLTQPHHWNMELSLRAPAALNPDIFERAVGRLVAVHPALRYRYSSENAGGRQRVAADETASLVEWIDLVGQSADRQQTTMGAAAARAHASLNLGSGPLLRAIAFRLEPALTQVFLVVHHLVVDGVSWRIIVDDLEATYKQLSQGHEAPLTPPSTSYRRWAKKLVAYAASPQIAAEREYWLSASKTVAPLPVDQATSRENGLESDLEVTPSFLNADDTRALLQDLPRLHQTQINDVLLAALAMALHQWSGNGEVAIDLEGHGREPLFDDVDLSRTVGWFTTIFPVTFRGDFANPLETLLATRATLRSIPNRGIGYGVLRYLSPDAALRDELASRPQPEVMFNYLGQFDQVSRPSPLFAIHDNVDFGPLHGLQGRRSHLFEIIARVVGGRLRLDWMYARTVYNGGSVARLIGAYHEALNRLIALGRVDGANGVSRRATGDLPASRDVVETCALSPIQELFLAALSSGSSVGLDQWIMTLEGPLDPAKLQQAWQHVVTQHPVLRTAIVVENLPQPQQVVFRDAKLEWHFEDCRGLDAAAQHLVLTTYEANDRNRPFRPGQAPLMRVGLFRIADNQSRLVWTFHHLVIDGWSCPLVFAAVGAAYESLQAGRPLPTKSVLAYSDYVRWLATRQTDESESFWRRVLTNLTEPTAPPFPAQPGSHSAPGAPAEYAGELSRKETAGLREIAKIASVSLNTLVQLAWAVVLSRRTGRDDVVFGVAFSGRPPELSGADSIVGPFVNNLPVRVRINPADRVLDAARALQEHQFELGLHQFTPLGRIQEWSTVPPTERLFNSLLVLQSYTTADALRRFGSVLSVSQLVAPVQTSYAVTVVAQPGDQLRISLIVDDATYDGRDVESALADTLEALRGIGIPGATFVDVFSRLAPPRRSSTPPKAVRVRKANPSPPRTGLESTLAAIWRRRFQVEDIGADENFFDLGGQSLLMLQVHRDVTDALRRDVSIVTMFQHPTIRGLAEHLETPSAAQDDSRALTDRAKRQTEALAKLRLRGKR